MPTAITSSGITFDDATTQTTSATKALGIGTAQLANGAVTAAKLSGAQTGSAPIYGCRAWVNFDGTKDTTGAASTANTNRLIRSSGNVASVLRNAAGSYTVTFTTAMPDTNYAVLFGSDFGTAESASRASIATGNVNVVSYDTNTGAAQDRPTVSVAIFR
jgi:hypothetical protein